MDGGDGGVTGSVRLRRIRTFFASGLPTGFFRHLSWQYVSAVAGLLFGFAQTLLLGRALGTAQLGIIALCLSYPTIVFQCVELRLHEAVIKYVLEFWEAKDERKVLAATKLSLYVDGASGLLAFLVAVAVTPLVHTTMLRGVDYRFVGLGIITIAFNNVALATCTGVLRVFNQFKQSSVLNIIVSGTKLALTAFGIYRLQWGVFEVMLLGAASSLFSNVALLVLALRELHKHTHARWRDSPVASLRPRLREMSRFTGTTYLFSLSSIPMRDIEVPILAAFGSLSDVGSYRIAKNFMQALWTLSDPAFVVVYPELAKLWARRDLKGIHRFIVRIAAVGGLGILALSCTAFAVVPWFIQKSVGEQFAEAGHLFRWMLWGAVFWGPLLWLHPLVTAAGKPGITLKATIVGGLVTTVAYLALVPLWGGRGAALAYAANTPIVMAVAWWLARSSGLLQFSREEPPKVAR